MQSVEIRPVQNQAEQQALFDQRWRVLRQPIGMAQGTEQDSYEDQAFHLIALWNGEIIGSGRLRKLSEELGSIAYVCVLPEFQSQGIGTQLMQKLIEVAQEQKLKGIRLMARLNTLTFYQKMGFIKHNEPFDFLGIPHQFMMLNLPYSPKKL